MLLPFKSPPNHLCILRLSALGDVCHALAVVRTIQTFWPATKITWIIGKLEFGLLGDIPNIEFIIFDKSAGWRAYLNLKRTLKGRQFDVLLQMQASLRASLVSMCITSHVKLGFDRPRAKDGQWMFSNMRIDSVAEQHVLDGLFGFSKALGISQKVLNWNIPIANEAHGFAEKNLPGDQPTLVISPCSSDRLRNWRNWHSDRYAAVADYAAKKHHMRIVLTGGNTQLEQDYSDRIIHMTRCKPLNLIGKTDLKQLLAIIKKGSLLISPDSGPVHMATAVNTSVIGLYVTSNPLRTGPYLSQRWVVNKYPQALENEFGKKVAEVSWGKRVRNPRAMEMIKVEDVINKLDEYMQSSTVNS